MSIEAHAHPSSAFRRGWSRSRQWDRPSDVPRWLSHLCILLAVLAPVLSGCSPTAYPDLERPATDTDVLPTQVTEEFAERFQPGSARLVGVHDDMQVFLAYGKIAPVCILIIDATEPSSACGAPQVGLALTDIAFRVITPVDAIPPGWEELSTNVIFTTEREN